MWIYKTVLRKRGTGVSISVPEMGQNVSCRNCPSTYILHKLVVWARCKHSYSYTAQCRHTASNVQIIEPSYIGFEKRGARVCEHGQGLSDGVKMIRAKLPRVPAQKTIMNCPNSEITKTGVNDDAELSSCIRHLSVSLYMSVIARIKSDIHRT